MGQRTAMESTHDAKPFCVGCGWDSQAFPSETHLGHNRPWHTHGTWRTLGTSTRVAAPAELAPPRCCKKLTHRLRDQHGGVYGGQRTRHHTRRGDAGNLGVHGTEHELPYCTLRGSAVHVPCRTGGVRGGHRHRVPRAAAYADQGVLRLPLGVRAGAQQQRVPRVPGPPGEGRRRGLDLAGRVGGWCRAEPVGLGAPWG